MADFSIFGEITGDASSFMEAISQAQGAMSSFADLAGGVMAGIGGAALFSSLTGGISQLAQYVTSTASDFQSYGQTFTNTLDNLSQESSTASDVVSAGAAKQAASMLEAQDALITYNEKIKEINQNIADVMQGTNITDAISKYQDALQTAQQQYADKVASINQQIVDATNQMNQTITDKQQSMQDSLADMQAQHQVTMADTAEKQQQELANATTQTAKLALEKKFQQENQLTEDSYQRAYALKQQQEQRSLDETTAKAKQQADTKIEAYQDELAKEATAEADKEAKLKTNLDNEVAKYKEANDKKLAQYQQELADEERSYQLSVAKRETSAAGGGSGGGKGVFSFGPLAEMEKGQEFFTNINESASKLQSHIAYFSQTVPFNLHDIEQADQGFAALGLNVEKTNPIVADLAGHWHTSIATASQAITDEIAGNGRMLAYNFHITKDDLIKAFGGEAPKSVNDLMKAFQNLDTNAQLRGSFKGGALVAMNTLPGQMSNIKDKLDLAALSFMGISTSADTFGKVNPGGIFDILQRSLSGVGNWLSAHQEEINTFMKNLGKAIVDIGGWVKNNFTPAWDALYPSLVSVTKSVMDLYSKLAPVLLPVLQFLAKIIIDDVIYSLKLLFDSINTVVTIVNNIWDLMRRFGDWLSSHFTSQIKSLGDLFKTVGSMLSYLDPFAKHSPSLVDQVTSGVSLIKSQYESIGSMRINAPQIGQLASATGAALSGNTGVGSYNSNQYSTSVAMNNTFNVNSQSNANMVAEYLAFQLEQRGIV